MNLAAQDRHGVGRRTRQRGPSASCVARSPAGTPLPNRDTPRNDEEIARGRAEAEGTPPPHGEPAALVRRRPGDRFTSRSHDRTSPWRRPPVHREDGAGKERCAADDIQPAPRRVPGTPAGGPPTRPAPGKGLSPGTPAWAAGPLAARRLPGPRPGTAAGGASAALSGATPPGARPPPPGRRLAARPGRPGSGTPAPAENGTPSGGTPGPSAAWSFPRAAAPWPSGPGTARCGYGTPGRGRERPNCRGTSAGCARSPSPRTARRWPREDRAGHQALARGHRPGVAHSEGARALGQRDGLLRRTTELR